MLTLVPHHGGKALCDSIKITFRQSRYVDPTILCCADAKIRAKGLHLFLGEAGVREHALLLRQTGEVLHNLSISQFLAQDLSHERDAFAHFIQFSRPIRAQFRITQHGCNDPRAMAWWHRVTRPNNRFGGGLSLRKVFWCTCDQRHRASPLSVDSNILVKRTRNRHFANRSREDTQAGHVFFHTIAQTLIRAVYERQQFAINNEAGQFLPLLDRQINSGGVVTTGMEKNCVTGLRMRYQMGYEYICKIWTSEPDRFNLNPIHQMPGLNT